MLSGVLHCGFLCNSTMLFFLECDIWVICCFSFFSAANLIEEIPSKWEKHGDLVILPAGAFSSVEWARLGCNKRGSEL